MTNIGRVIGWKFNHQEGMSTRDGVIIEFPGGIPTQTDQDTWTAEYLVEFPEGFDEWEETMQRTDSGMPRYLEDIFNRDGTDGLPQVLIDKYNTKKDLRATKP